MTDQPYAALVAAARTTHDRLLEVPAGKLPPVDRQPLASPAGSARAR